jgi:hypothetical protein
VKAVLAANEFTIIDKEWPSVFSSYFNREENSLLDVLFRNHRVNNKDFDGLGAPNLFSYTGQVAEWVRYGL